MRLLGTLLPIMVCMMFGLGMTQAQLGGVHLEHNRCGHEYAKAQETKRLQAFEEWITKEINSLALLEERNEDSILTIPVVFHIVHYGEEIGEGVNLSQEAIYAQLEQVNNDLRRRAGTSGFNDFSFGADMELELRPALFDEDDNLMAEPGINRIAVQDAELMNNSFSETYVNHLVKPATQWSPFEYLNIWVVKLSDNLLGFAQFPVGSGLDGITDDEVVPEQDGIVLHYAIVGSTDYPNTAAYNTIYEANRFGRILTHELGHWLGLRHIWGDGGGCDADDYCEDTPNAIGPNFACPEEHFSCGSYDLVENYMDYTNDACVNTFTQDQKNRVYAVLSKSPRRRDLLVSDKATPLDDVDLLSFDVELEEDVAYITWETSSETNLSHYHLMKSLDGENFTFLAEITAEGNVGVPASYQYEDEQLENGLNYYRLIKVGNDGDDAQLGLKSINYYKGFLVDVFPNPTSGKIDVTVLAEKEGEADLLIYDMAGRKLIQRSIFLEEGNNISQQDVTKLFKGLYVLKIVQGNWVKCVKIEKF